MKKQKNTGYTIGDLTQREKEVLTHMAQGLSTIQIAELIKLSALTIETHRKSIIRKLRAANAVGAVALALRMKLIK
ncbi:MAG: LuxR C-terminal-related transcriptional regulator [Chitinophagales bacterium]